jgi:hypothetical protein
MSAAEPADHTLPALGERGERTAAIIDLTTRSRARRPGKGRRVSTPQPGPDPAGGTSPQQQLAEHIETTFNNHRLSLTDEIAKSAFAVTLEIVRGLLAGAEAQGIVGAEQLLELDELVKGMAAAPALIERSG